MFSEILGQVHGKEQNVFVELVENKHVNSKKEVKRQGITYRQDKKLHVLVLVQHTFFYFTLESFFFDSNTCFAV